MKPGNQERPAFALSIRQPWAYAILYLGKTVENRTWSTPFRGRVVIHAGKTMDQEGLDWLRLHGFKVPAHLPTGAYLGEVTIGDCCPANALVRDIWTFGPWCFTLRDPVAYEAPVPGRGSLGFYRAGATQR